MGKIVELLVALEDEQLIEAVKEDLKAGVAPAKILADCQAGMVAIGEEFSQERMFVSDLMMASAIFKDVSELLLPYLSAADAGEGLGKVVVGTVRDDIHDIGKDIVVNMLQAANFEVIDLGVDVPPADFVKALQENNANVLALSCLLASCYTSILDTVEALKAAGIRDQVNVIIGGGPVDEHVVAYSGADAFGADAQAAVNYCKEVLA